MTDAVETTNSENSLPGIFLFFGVALLILGVVSIVASSFITLSTVVLLGILLLAAAVMQFVHAFKSARGNRMFLDILSGLLYLVVGLMIINSPVAGALSLTLLMGIFFIVTGIVRCVYAVIHRKELMMGWFLMGAIANFVLGAIILAEWPISGLWVIGLFVGVEMIMHGIAWIALSNAMRTVST